MNKRNKTMEARRVFPARCALFWCSDGVSNSKTVYCTRHLRQHQRTGNPLVGDAKALYEIVTKSTGIIRSLLAVTTTTAEDGSVHCVHCHAVVQDGVLQHADGCAVETARDFVLVE